MADKLMYILKNVKPKKNFGEECNNQSIISFLPV